MKRRMGRVAALALVWGMLGCDGLTAEEVDQSLEEGVCATKAERAQTACLLCEMVVEAECADELALSCEEQLSHYEACVDACACDQPGEDEDEEVDCEVACRDLCDTLRGRYLACAKDHCDVDCL